jgi:hypothetical protein
MFTYADADTELSPRQDVDRRGFSRVPGCGARPLRWLPAPSARYSIPTASAPTSASLWWNARRGDDCVVGDLMITNKPAIDLIRRGVF